MRKKEKRQVEVLNTMCFNHYLFQLSSIAMCQFDYKNLPDTITKEHVERMLFFSGACVFYYDDVLKKYVALDVNPNGRFDLNNEPIYRIGYGQNGYHVELNKNNSVIIYNNILKMPTQQSALFYAERLADLQRTFDVNTKALKNPRIFQGNKKQELTFRQAYEDYDGNTPVMYLSDELNLDDCFKSISGDTQNHLPQIIEAKKEIWSEYLNTLGITSTTISKKERLITDEVSKSLGGAIANFSTRYKCRKNAIEQINKMFGLNIEVIDISKMNEEKEVVENE